MTDILSNTQVPDTPDVRAAQTRLDAAQAEWVDAGVEAGLLVASLSPVGGQVADGISLARNIAGGNYGAAIVDGRALFRCLEMFSKAGLGAVESLVACSKPKNC